MKRHAPLIMLIVGIFLVGILVAACQAPPAEVPNTPDGDPIICNSPYIRVGDECCLDVNGNNICDRDEADSSPEAPEEPETPELPASERCAELDFQLKNVCAKGTAIQYFFIVGDVPIESFNLTIIHNKPNSTGETYTSTIVSGGAAEKVVNGQIRLPPYIYSEAVVTSIPCNVSKTFGPGFPDVLPACN